MAGISLKVMVLSGTAAVGVVGLREVAVGCQPHIDA